MSAIEVEVKFVVDDGPALEAQLTALGFVLVTPSTFERNVLYDTSEHTLRTSRSILRIRHYGERWVLTHKCLPRDYAASERHKHRIETETAIEDGAALDSIFHSLGYQPTFVYEKWRTEYADSVGHCMIDRTPIGLFAELEGPEEWIDRIYSALGLEPSALSTLSYGRLFEEWRTRSGSSARNLAFDEIPATT